MANRLIGNVLIIDSTGTAISLNSVWPGKNAKVASIKLAATNTTSVLELNDSANTANVISVLKSPDNNPMPVTHYLGGVYFSELAVKTLTAGTGYIYFV